MEDKQITVEEFKSRTLRSRWAQRFSEQEDEIVALTAELAATRQRLEQVELELEAFRDVDSSSKQDGE